MFFQWDNIKKEKVISKKINDARNVYMLEDCSGICNSIFKVICAILLLLQ